LNHTEFAALSAEQSSPGAVAAFARAHRLTVALSGASDFVSDGTQSVTIGNGDSLMAKVTAMGCAVSALTAACLAVEPDPFHACTAALLIAGIAGEVAAEQAAGPGSFAVAILDAFHGLDSATIMSRAKVA
jgi:hydroxyethylthiazole kinase